MKDKPVILMIAPSCFPVTCPEAIVNAKLVLAGLKAGWEIDIISQDRFGFGYPNQGAQVWEPVASHVAHCPELIRGVNVRRLWDELRGAVSTRYLILGAGWARSAIQAARSLMSVKHYDLILSRPSGGDLAALALARQTGLPWVMNWNDPWPSSKYPPPYGQGATSSLPWNLRRFFNDVAQHATWHTFCCERLREYVCSYMPEGIMARSSVIPHIALERFRLAGKPNNQKFTLCHAGNLGRPRSATVFLKGVKTFLTETNNCRTVTVKFLGSNTEDLAPIIHDLHLEDYVVVEPPKPYEESLEILAQSDVVVIIEASCEEGIFLPSKYVDYIQTGRPILALSPAVGTLADIIAEHGGGLAVDCQSAEAVARAIKTLYSHWQLGTLDETYGSSGLFELFNENNVLSLYLETFKLISLSI